MPENSTIPYIRLPRSLLRDPLWLDLPLAYQHVFLVLVEKVCFKPQKFDDHGVLIDLLPGQICISERELLKFCNKHVSRNDIQRSIKKFILYDFVSQEVSHKKSILTIKHRDTYDLILKSSEPRNEPNLSQTRAKLEPEKNNVNKEEKEEEQYIPREALNQKVIGLDFVNENFDESSSNENIIENQKLAEESKHNLYYSDVTNSKETETKSNKNECLDIKNVKKQKEPSEQAISLMEFFYNSLSNHVPTIRSIPSTPQKRTEMALPFDQVLKEYSELEIKRSIDYAHLNAFWKSIIISPKKLKEKVGTLLTQCEEQHATHQGHSKSNPRGEPRFKPKNVLSADD